MSALAKPPNGPPGRLEGADKGLLLLLSLEESIATRILGQLSQEEVRRLRGAADRVREAQPSALAAVHREFSEIIRRGVPASLKGSGAYLRRLVGKAHGEGAAAEVWTDRQEPQGPAAAFAQLDTATVLGVLEREHAQTIAVILSQLPPPRAAEILTRLPVERQADVSLRLARIETVPIATIQEIERQFALEVEALTEGARRSIDGLQALADLVKRIPGERSQALLEELSALDTTIGDRVRRSLFTFEDLIRVDARGMQVLLKEISTEQLVLSLKTASDEIKEKVFGSVSSRAAAVIREELEVLGPARVSDVEEAQQAIVDAALALEREGRIQIAREGGSEYV